MAGWWVGMVGDRCGAGGDGRIWDLRGAGGVVRGGGGGDSDEDLGPLPRAIRGSQQVRRIHTWQRPRPTVAALQRDRRCASARAGDGPALNGRARYRFRRLGSLGLEKLASVVEWVGVIHWASGYQ